MRLRPVFTIVAEIAAGIPLVEGPGSETYIPITGGTVTGDIEGIVVPGGGDWSREHPWGFSVNARYQLQTVAGSIIDVHNVGVGRRDDHGDPEYFMTTPVFRTVDPGLAWLLSSVFLGRASGRPEAATIEVFAVAQR